MRKCWHFWRRWEHFYMGPNTKPKFGCRACRVEWARIRGLVF